jgi:hypothetical protein
MSWALRYLGTTDKTTLRILPAPRGIDTLVTAVGEPLYPTASPICYAVGGDGDHRTVEFTLEKVADVGIGTQLLKHALPPAGLSGPDHHEIGVLADDLL